MTKFTKERLQELADEYTICKVSRDERIAMARQLLAGLEQEPVAWVRYCSDGTIDGPLLNYQIEDCRKPTWTPLYAAPQLPQPAVGNDFLPKNLDLALGVLGMAIPESREEFNLQQERWIQRLIDRVIRCADELCPQPLLLVPDEKCDDDGTTTSEFDHGWNACRAAMLQGEAIKHPSSTQTSDGGGNAEEIKHPSCNELVGQLYTLPEWLQQAHKLAELHGTSFVVFRHGEVAQCADPTKVIISFTDEGLGHQSAAPQQEAN